MDGTGRLSMDGAGCLSMDGAGHVYQWMGRPLTWNKITQYAAFECCHSTCADENSACITRLQKETNI